MRKYIYFGHKNARTQALTASVTSEDQNFEITDGTFGIDVSNISDDVGLFTSETLVADLLVDANHTGDFGTHYGTPTTGETIRIHPNALSYDGTSKVTVKTKAQDPVFGILMSSTSGDNHVTITQNKPLVVEDAVVLCSDLILGVQQVNNTSAKISFRPHTNDSQDADAIDSVTCTYDTGKFKEFSQMVNDCIMDDRNQGGMVVFADEWNGIYYGGNPAGVSAVAVTMDT